MIQKTKQYVFQKGFYFFFNFRERHSKLEMKVLDYELTKIMNYITFPVTMTLLYESEGDWCTVLSQLFFTWQMQLQILNGNAINFKQLGEHMDICEMVEFMKYHFLPVIYKAPQILVSKSLMPTFLLLINKVTWTSITLFVLHIKWLEAKPRDLKG